MAAAVHPRKRHLAPNASSADQGSNTHYALLLLLLWLYCCCSLALLPAGAQQHVPAAVQHLMDSASPIYDMYAACEGCEAAAQEAYVAQRAYDVSGWGSMRQGLARVWLGFAGLIAPACEGCEAAAQEAYAVAQCTYVVSVLEFD